MDSGFDVRVGGGQLITCSDVLEQVGLCVLVENFYTFIRVHPFFVQFNRILYGWYFNVGNCLCWICMAVDLYTRPSIYAEYSFRVTVFYAAEDRVNGVCQYTK